jgi:small-conductance mechanosensitive channel
MDAIVSQLQNIIQTDWVIKLILSVGIALVAFIADRIVSRFLSRKFCRDHHIVPEGSIFITIARAFIWAVAFCAILNKAFGIDVTAVVMALGVGGIALSLGFQDTLSNFIGGLQVSLMKIIKPGDTIRIGTNCGKVKDITWRHTTIINELGEVVIIPNSIINTSALTQLPPQEEAPK